jgi:hypothetical protein
MVGGEHPNATYRQTWWGTGYPADPLEDVAVVGELRV